MIDAGLFTRVFVATAATLFALVPSHSDASITTRWDCNGYVGNGYNQSRPQFKRFYELSHVVATVCPTDHLKRNRPCKFYFDNKSYESYYLDGGAELSIFKGASGDYFEGHFTPATGYLFYKLSDGPVGTNQNETQRWFRGYCYER